jgi:hypothetical protein
MGMAIVAWPRFCRQPRTPQKARPWGASGVDRSTRPSKGAIMLKMQASALAEAAKPPSAMRSWLIVEKARETA